MDISEICNPFTQVKSRNRRRSPPSPITNVSTLGALGVTTRKRQGMDCGYEPKGVGRLPNSVRRDRLTKAAIVDGV